MNDWFLRGLDDSTKQERTSTPDGEGAEQR